MQIEKSGNYSFNFTNEEGIASLKIGFSANSEFYFS